MTFFGLKCDQSNKNRAEVVLRSTGNAGVDTIFGYPGGAVHKIYEFVVNFMDSITHILARHEQGTVHIAEGYTKFTGKVGVALVTTGPGATNTVTGIANVYMDSTTLVVISEWRTKRFLRELPPRVCRFAKLTNAQSG